MNKCNADLQVEQLLAVFNIYYNQICDNFITASVIIAAFTCRLSADISFNISLPTQIMAA
jgi:hypothetical protein